MISPLENTIKKLNAVGIGAVRISARGVPHLVTEKSSVTWFWKNRKYRVFMPYPGNGQQTRTDFINAQEVKQFIEQKEKENDSSSSY